MAYKRKGHLTVTGEWAKHLRKFWRRQYWKGERNAGKKAALKEIVDKAIEKGLKSRIIEEKNFDKEFKKHSAKWRKHYSG